MEGFSSTKFLGAAISAIKGGWAALKPDLARRKVNAGERYDPDTIGKILDEALDMLGGKNLKGTSILFTVRRMISSPPEEFNYSHINDWITEARTRDALKGAVLAVFNGDDDSAYRAIAEEDFERVALTSRTLAEGPINAALEFMANSVSAYLSPSDKLILDTVVSTSGKQVDLLQDLRQRQDETVKTIKEVGERLERDIENLKADERDFAAQDALDTFVERSFQYAVSRRHFPEARADEEILALAERIYAGNLKRTSNHIKIEVLRYAARVSLDRDINEAEAWLARARKLDGSVDFRIDDARILIHKKSYPDSLILLRDLDSPVARGLLLSALEKKDGINAALLYAQQAGLVPASLDAWALASFSSRMQDAGLVDESESFLTGATAQQVEECPIILYLRTIVRIRLCLSEETRREFNAYLPLHPKVVKFSDNPEKVRTRAAALSDIRQCVAAIKDLDVPTFLQHAKQLEVWLALSSSDDDVSTAAREELCQYAQDPSKAVLYYRLISDYGVTCDKEKVSAYLNTRRILGGWTHEELITGMLMALEAESPEETLQFLDENKSVLTFTEN